MTDSPTSTARAISPDSGEIWTTEGAWRVADDIHRIPLPLPMDGLRAVNVYVVEGADGLTMVDGGWAIDAAREVFERSLRSIGFGIGDIRRFLVTHIHRDHFTLASVLGREVGAEVVLGVEERPAIEQIRGEGAYAGTDPSFGPMLVSAGAPDLARSWEEYRGEDAPDLASWGYPDTWLSGDTTVAAGARSLDAVHTPGHTAGHYVYADQADGLLFAGDHVLPTITPSIGFVLPPVPDPLGAFMRSLLRVRALPDLRLLPAHGPVAPSTHARIDELLAHHEDRLALCRALLGHEGVTARDVAEQLTWTRRERTFASLDVFNRGMAVMETKAHLDLLVARGEALSGVADGVDHYRVVSVGPPL